MKKKYLYLALLPLLAGPLAFVQAGGGMGGMGGGMGGMGGMPPGAGGAAPAPAASATPVKEDFKPSTLNQPQQQYPMVNSDRFARFRIVAPNAQSVTVSLGLGGSGGTTLKKADDGSWMGTTAGPMDEGFHYYHLSVDG